MRWSKRDINWGEVRTAQHWILKKRGHDIIDEMVKCGIPRARVYERLARRMRVQVTGAHFSQVSDLHTLFRMVQLLEKMEELAKRPQGWRGMVPKQKYNYKEMFTDKRVLRAVALRNALRGKPWYFRLLMRIRATIRL